MKRNKPKHISAHAWKKHQRLTEKLRKGKPSCTPRYSPDTMPR
jgi:hypothetical protein